MNSVEMYYEMSKLLETVDKSHEIEDKLDTDTAFLVLNMAMLRFINEKYLNKATASENIEFLQKRSDDLSGLIKRTLITSAAISSGPYSGIGYTVSLGSLGDYLYYIRSDSYLNRTGSIYPTGSGQYAWVNNAVAKSYDEVEKVLTTPFNKPIVREPLVIFEQNTTMLVIVDSFTTVNTEANQGIALTYLAKPKHLGLEDTANTTTVCQLAWQTHEEIVRLAVDIYIKEYKYILSQKQSK